MNTSIPNTYLVVQLENTPTNHEFMNFSESDKNIIISAGITMFQSGHRNITYANDTKMKNIIQEMEKNHQSELKNKQNEIHILKSHAEIELAKRIQEINVTHSKSFRDMQAEIDSLSNANSKLRENDNWKDYQSLLDKYKSENESRIQEQKQLYSDLLKSKEQEIGNKLIELNELRAKTIESLKISISSSRKGKKGEEDVDEIVKKYFKNADIENISNGEGSRGDRIYYIDGIKIMAEMKSYTSKIQYNSKERGVSKFIRDMEMNQDYQCGIMISLTSPIADKEKGVIKPMISPEYLDDGRPIIFIHPGDNASLLDSDELVFLGFQTVISIVKSLKNSKKMSDVLKNNKIINRLVSYIYKLKKEYNESRSDEIRKVKQLLECIESKNQQSLIDNIEQLINEFLQDTPFICDETTDASNP